MPHTSDVIVEAWGADLASCCEEAVAALTAGFADARRAAVTEHRSVHLPPGPAESLLIAVLEEVIFTLDTAPDVPVAAVVSPADDGGLDLVLVLADRQGIRSTGAVPKAISRSELDVESGPDGVRCRFLIDV